MMDTILLLGIFAILFYKELKPMIHIWLKKIKEHLFKKRLEKARMEIEIIGDEIAKKYPVNTYQQEWAGDNVEFYKHFNPEKERIAKKYKIDLRYHYFKY